MPILDPNSLEFISRSAEQTRRVGMRLGALLRTGDVLCLEGDLGSGKTTFTQGVAAGWGSLDSASSPTFVLVNVYRGAGDQKLFHLDAYRLSGASEATDLDLDAMLENGPLVVEWADRIRAALPPLSMRVLLRWVDENQRDMVISAVGPRNIELLNSLRRQMFGVR
jgi:tRNA threonylcarbamoyladenosine biosynthesis protein TsaE